MAFVDDSASAFHWVINKPEMSCGKTFNVGSGAWKKRAIAESIAELFDAEIVLSDYCDPDARDFILDCSELRKIGWSRRSDAFKTGLECLKNYMVKEDNGR